MNDEQMEALRAEEPPELRELRDKQAQLRGLLAAIQDVPEHHWPETLIRAMHLCSDEDRRVAKDMWMASLMKRYEDA